MENGEEKQKKILEDEEGKTGENYLCTNPAITEWKNCVPYCAPVPNPRLSMREPRQGCAKDCYFIAALSSIAWAANPVLSTVPLTKYTFRDPLLNGTTVVQLASQNLPVGNGKLVFADSTSGEIWPALYEKGYAKFKNVGYTDNNADHLKIGDLPEASGMTALLNILGGQNWGYYKMWDVNANNMAYLTTFPNPPGQTLQPNPNNSSNILTTGKTKYPMVAWTDQRALPAGLYNKHTYSLLGVYNGYIVLRNPYSNRDTAKILPEPNAGVLTAGTWNPDRIAENKIDFANNTDGIFALSSALFIQYFWRFGRVNNVNENPSNTITQFDPINPNP